LRASERAREKNSRDKKPNKARGNAL
jgi:hypothetical protein